MERKLNQMLLLCAYNKRDLPQVRLELTASGSLKHLYCF